MYYKSEIFYMQMLNVWINCEIFYLIYEVHQFITGE